MTDYRYVNPQVFAWPNSESHQGMVERLRLEALREERDQYYRHLIAIFHGPCTCTRHWCLRCLLQNIPWPRRAWGGGWLLGRMSYRECPRHFNSCPACIAEHGAMCMGDHPSVDWEVRHP